MREYIVRETDCGLATRQEIVGELVRCKDCKYNNACFTQSFVESEGVLPFDRSTWFCADGKRKDDG